MKKFLLVALLVSGCATGQGATPGPDFFSDDDTQYERAGTLTVLAEIATDYVIHKSLDDASSVLSVVQDMKQSIIDARTTEGWWVNTNRYRVLRQVGKKLISKLKSRLPSLILRGFSIKSLLRTGDRVVLAKSMAKDITHMIEEIGKSLNEDEFYQLLIGRFNRNIERLKTAREIG